MTLKPVADGGLPVGAVYGGITPAKSTNGTPLEPFGFDRIETGLQILDLTRFPDADRRHRRIKSEGVLCLKTLYYTPPGAQIAIIRNP